MRRRYGIQRLCQKHLQDGTKSDAIFRMVIICILLLRAWVVQGNFRNSRLCFVSLYTGYSNVAFEFIRAVDTNGLQSDHHLSGSNFKRKNEVGNSIFVVDDVCYVKHSSLIPHELQLEVQDDNLIVPPAVMSHFLKFLWYHHLNDVSNKLQIFYAVNFINERYAMYQ